MLILWSGEYLTGKSIGAATFPKPMEYLDFDDHFEMVQNARGKDGKPIISPEEYAKINVHKFQREKAHRLQFKTVLGGKQAPAHTAEAPQMMEKMNTILSDIMNGTRKCETLVIDSITVMFRLWKEAILSVNGQSQLQIPDYGTLETILYGQFIPTLKALPVKYVICIGHTDIEKDEVTGRVIEFPIGPSRAQGKAMGKEFDEVWRQEVSGDKYIIRTKKGGGLMQVGSRLDLPDMLESNWKEISKHCPK